MKFKSLSVLDFIEESKEWPKEDFIKNCYIHKEDLKKLDVDDKDSVYFGCGLAIWDLIKFLRNILFFNESQKYPATMNKDEFKQMIEIFNRYQDEKLDPNKYI